MTPAGAVYRNTNKQILVMFFYTFLGNKDSDIKVKEASFV